MATLALGLGAGPASADTTAGVDSVTDVSYASAHVTAHVDAVGETYWRFDYSSDGVNWVEQPGDAHGGPVAIDGSETFEADFTGLKGGTKYFVRVGYYNETTGEGGVSPEPNAEFTTLPVDPPVVLSVDDAGGVSYTTAKASGEVERPANADPAFDAQCNFEYVTDEQFTATGFDGAPQAPCETDPPSTPGVVSAPGASPVTANLTGLANGTTYHLRLTASNAGGSDSEAAASTFTTLAVGAPTVSIDPVTTFTDSTATFTGHINPGGTDPAFDVNWEFHCTPECLGVVAGNIPADNTSHEVTAAASGLEPNTTYEVELTATNAGGAQSAGPESFKTNAVAPGAETLPAFALLGGTEALVGGRVNPRHSATKYWIEYGPGPGGPSPIYPSAIPADKEGDAGSGGQLVFATQTIAGLSPASTYHFRIVAENATGTTTGEDISFETLAPPPPPASCSNAKLRSETGSAALGECRAYELTTPPAKNGADIFTTADSTPDGNRLAYNSLGSFANAESNSAVVAYVAQRSATGWTSRSMQPKIGVPEVGFNGNFLPGEVTNDLTKAISFGTSAVADEPAVKNILLKELDGSTTWVSKPTVDNVPIAEKDYVGRSADGSHIIFESPQPFSDQGSGDWQLWEWVEGEVRLASVLPGGSLPAGAAAAGSGINGSIVGGTGYSGMLVQPTVMSEDGSRIFFGLGHGSGATGIFVRINGTKTRRLDVTQRTGSVVGAPTEASFAGAAADGSIAVFQSPVQLTDDATSGGGLYAYDLEEDELRFLSAGATGPEGAQVTGAALISDDGSHVFFTAQSALIPDKGIAGRRNLYVSDDAGVHFIATLAGDDDLEKIGATPDGRYFVFQSYERLTSFDNDGHAEVYRFDAEQDSLTCISCGLEAAAATGDASARAYPKPRGVPSEFPQAFRAGVITDDGSRVLFETTQGLLPADVNGLADVYLYRDGNLQLISTGTSKYASEVGGITPDGGSIFLLVRDSLVGQDIDGGARDVYAARVDGGFPAPPVPSPCESSDACQRAPSGAPAFAAPTTTAPGRGNPAGRHKKKPKACKGKAKMKHGKCVSKGQTHQKKQGKRASKSGRGK